MSNDLYLVKPSKELEKEIWAYRQEFLDSGARNVNGASGIARFEDFDVWLEFVKAIEKDRLSMQNVHASTFFSIRSSDHKIIGSMQLRHSLTPELEKHGGHIGYSVRPTERGKGYGAQQLRLILDVACHMNIPRVMISCNKDNVASSKTALSCGGVLTSESVYEGKEQLVYWIEQGQVSLPNTTRTVKSESRNLFGLA